MGIIVKVYIENNDEEIDIVTLNSEDKKSSSVTITASVIKDYLNKLSRNEDLSSPRSDRITSKKPNCESNESNATVNYCNEDEKRSHGDSLVRSSVENDKSNLNSDVIQSENVTCSQSGIHETFTPNNEFLSEKNADKSKEHEVISQNLNSNKSLSDVRDCIQTIDDINESGNCVIEQDKLVAITTDCDTPGELLNIEVPASGRIVEDTYLSMCVDDGPSENPGLENAASSTLDTDAHSQIAVTRSDGTVCDKNVDFDLKNYGGNKLRNDDSSSNYEMWVEPETGAENVIASLKNVSYEVDDFLNMANTTSTQQNQSISDLRLSGVSLFSNEISYSPGMYLEELDDENELEEYFVIEKIAASRFNEETKVLEFLLKAQKCVARKEPWAPIRTNITDLTISDARCLFIQCPKGFKSYRRKVHEKFDQYVQFVDMESGFMYDVPSETMSNCPSVVSVTTNEFSSVVTADVVVDPQKSLNDACLMEPCLDDNKNITPTKWPKNGENINTMTDIGLPSSHFYIGDMVPGLGDQLVEFVENIQSPLTNSISETEIFKKPSNISLSDRPRKKYRNDIKHLQCPQCPYKTVRASTLGNHLRRHTKEFLKCELCPKRYLNSKSLKNHEKTHRNGELSSEEDVATGVGDYFAKSLQNRFPKNMKKEVSVESPLDRYSSINLEHSQSSVILNEAVIPNRILFNDRNVKCKMKQNLKKQLKNPRGRPNKRMKVEMENKPDNTEIIELCDDDNPSKCNVPADILTNAAPCQSEVLPKSLFHSVNNAIGSDNLPGLVAETSSDFPDFVKRERKETCDVCKQSFETSFDLFDHKKQFHKYPIVLLKRLSISF